jgi:hypothetical protein
MTRTEFAERISSGLAGWLQQLAAQNLEDQVGEDAARDELVRMISAQRSFVPDTSLRPKNAAHIDLICRTAGYVTSTSGGVGGEP